MRNVAIVGLLALAGCAGQTNYIPPSTAPSASNTVLIAKPVDTVWKQMVRGIGTRFFVINNLDKDSGLINVSYRGDPTLFVDCGRITSHVQNLRGKRDYDFPAASPAQTYETMNANRLFKIDRKMVLSGRANVIVQQESGQTRVTVNTRYIITRTTQIWQPGQRFPQNFTHTANFDSGQTATVGTAPTAITCVANGKFERQILNLASPKPKS